MLGLLFAGSGQSAVGYKGTERGENETIRTILII